jgi:AcrR family transcriptional regulator
MLRVNDRRVIAAQATQRAIVETAARLFINRGYHAATLGEIAREAGVAI